MRTTDLTAERQLRARKRLAATVRQVVVHATLDEREQVDRLLDCVDAGLLTVDQAHDVLRDVQAAHQRQAA